MSRVVKPGAGVSMRLRLCEACEVGHCFVIDAGGVNVIYCGPVERAVVTHNADVFINPADYEEMLRKRIEGAS